MSRMKAKITKLANRKMLLVLMLPVLVLGIVVLPVASVHANTAYSGTVFGRSAFRGYFDNRYYDGSGHTDLLNSPMPTSIDTVSELVNYLRGLYTSGVTKHRTAAAVIVHTMLGKNGADASRSISNADWTALTARLNYHNSFGGISWSESRRSCGVINSWYQPPSYNDVSWRIRSSTLSCVDPTIVIRDTSNRIVYELNRRCGNPMGRYSGLLQPPPASITPRIWLNGSESNKNLEATDGSAQFYHRITVNSYSGRNHTITAQVQRYLSTTTSCSSGGSWTTVTTRTINITSRTTYTVAGPHNTSWNPNTHKRVCERLTITNRDGASVPNGTSITRYANIRSGNISVTTSGTSEAEPGQSFSMNGRIVASPGSGTNGFSMTYSISYTSNVSGLTPPSSRSGTVLVNEPTTIENPFSGTIPTGATPGSTVCVTARVTNPSQSQYPNYFATSASETFCLKVVAKPVVSVRGGDVSAGPGFAPNCAAVPDAGITGWNTNTGAYDGAGTQFGAFALGRITGFASAKINSSGATPPRSLAFANTPASSGEEYGGSFGSLPCITDHFGLMPANVQSLPSLASLNNNTPSGAYLAANSNNMPSNLMFNGRQITVYVEGDVYLGGNIRYNRTGTWSSPSEIPGFKLVVKGDIYIRNTVTELNGIYIAQGDGTNGGNIYTCATAPGNAVNTGNTTSSSLYSACNTPLTINGAFAAHKIYFTRTYGTAFNNVPAELFNYLPELWLTPWPDTSESNSTKYDSITGLPPIL